MDKINNIIKIIEKELKVNREIIKEAIRKNDLNKYGDYSILCYIFKNHFKESPLIIAKKIADILKANGIKICEVVGPYVNIYIEENIVDAFFSHLNIKEKSINEKIFIIYKIENSFEVLELNDFYKLIITEFIKRLYMQEGYDLECYNPIKDNEKTLSINYILEKIRSMGAVKQYFYEEIVEFKEFNLPPLIIGDKGYGLTLEDLAYPLHKLYDKDVSKAIIINSKYENMRYNQIYYLMKKLDYELAEKLENVSLGLIKINENLKKYTRNNNDIIKLLIKRSREEVVCIFEKYKININKIDIERISIENLIFKFLKNDIGKDIIFDYYNSFIIKDNNYLKVRITQYYLYEKFKNYREKELVINYDYIDLKDKLELKNIIDDYKKAINTSRKNYSSSEIIKLIDNVVDKIVIGYEDEVENEKNILYLIICDILDNAFNVLGVSNDILINKMKKLSLHQ